MSEGATRVRPGQVRPARNADIDALLRLEEAAFPGDRLTRREFRDAIRSRATVTLAATVPPGEGDALAGYVFMQTRRGSETARITSLAVAESAGRRGLGRLLVESAEAEALRRGCSRIRLEVRADNGRAARLYRAAGYRHVGREEDYYEDGCAAERYEKALAG